MPAPVPVNVTCRKCGLRVWCNDTPNREAVHCPDCGILLAEPGMLNDWPHLQRPHVSFTPLDQLPYLGSWWDATCINGHTSWLTLPLLSLREREWTCPACKAELVWGSGRPLLKWTGPW